MLRNNDHSFFDFLCVEWREVFVIFALSKT
nr:MAG TPA: hypothetical protein [Caudoviricetes sp.]